MNMERDDEPLDASRDGGQSESDSDPQPERTDRFRRLLRGTDSAASSEPADNFQTPPHRHPTGDPDQTGGWLAEGLFDETEEDPSEDLSVGPALDLEDLSPSRTRVEDLPKPLPPPQFEQEPGPLPARVPGRDTGSTRVTPAAYRGETPPASPPRKRKRGRIRDQGGTLGCLVRMGILALFGLLAVLIAILSFGVYQYFSLASTLPSVEDLYQNAAQFETTRILDREGNLLYEILDPQAGRRTFVPMEKISPYLVAATISTEDSQFYSNPGFDPFGILRAYIQNFQEGGIASGASTITQQIARNLLLSPEERSQQTALRKIREIMLATEITRRYTKDEILELYLNQNFYGNLAYGIEAAAQTYFNSSAENLTLSQASFLAGLVQAPAIYDVYTNREITLDRQKQVLTLMIFTSEEQGCIYVSNAALPICINPELAGIAAAELTEYEFNPPAVSIQFPHWVNFVRTELETLFDPQTIYRSGFTVHTTLDPYLQAEAQRILQQHIATLQENQVSTGALVALRPNTGEILAMIGSAEYENEAIGGQINMAIRPRQPGSAIKPLIYAAAFELGWTPATLIWDVESEFPPSGDPNDPREPYVPSNFDKKFHGPVTARYALANSFNVPAVKTLDFVGIFDDPNTGEVEGIVPFLERFGITTLTRDDYGLSLTLGGAEITPLELTNAFSVFATNGLRFNPFAITRIVDHTGDMVYEYQPQEGIQVLRPEHSFLINSILSDDSARSAMFGRNSVLTLPVQVAAKTGTSGTSDRVFDNWTVGYTPDLATGVWAGNADYTELVDTTGFKGAAPIWNQFMLVALEHLTGGQGTAFQRPAGILEAAICAVSGAEPSEWCPTHRIEFFAEGQPPLPKEHDLWRKVWIDTFTLKLASTDCSEYVEERLGLAVIDPWGKKWLEETSDGQAWAERMGFEDNKLFFVPEDTCGPNDPHAVVEITQPGEFGVLVSDTVEIFGIASATDNFLDWILEYGVGSNPDLLPDIASGDEPVRDSSKLYEWDISELPNGPASLILTVRNSEGGKAQHTIRLTISRPTPTPTPTPTATETPTLTPVPSETPTPSITPTPSPTLP